MAPGSCFRNLRAGLAPALAKMAGALLVLAACGGDSYSPTATLPTSPTPTPTVTSVTGSYSFDFWRDSGAGGDEVQVLLDGVVLCTGIDGGAYDYVVVSCNSGKLGAVAVGHHTLGVKLTSQGVSPTGFHVTGRVDVALFVDGRTVDSQSASWDERVTLATGDTWNGVFEIREWAG